MIVVSVHAQEDIDEDSEEHKHCGNEQRYRIKPLQISFPIIQTNIFRLDIFAQRFPPKKKELNESFDMVFLIKLFLF